MNATLFGSIHTYAIARLPSSMSLKREVSQAYGTIFAQIDAITVSFIPPCFSFSPIWKFRSLIGTMAAISSIRTSGDRIEIVDQLLLPHTQGWIEIDTIEKAYEAIKSMKVC